MFLHTIELNKRSVATLRIIQLSRPASTLAALSSRVSAFILYDQDYDNDNDDNDDDDVAMVSVEGMGISR